MRSIFCIGLFAMIKASSYLDNIPKDINVLFPNTNKSNSVSLNETAFFDIEKIDVDKLMEKIGSINTSFLDHEMDARKRGVFLNRTQIGDDAYRTGYSNAADIIAKQKLCDMMLQVIYMSRHGVRRLESSPFFNKEDVGYRMGLLYSKLRKLHRKMRDIYQTMTNKQHKVFFAAGMYGEVNRDLEREDKYMILHHRMVKLHTDFLYYFWVMIKIDGMFTELNDVRVRQPKNNDTAGISIENKEIG